MSPLDPTDEPRIVFSYGTLQEATVQQALFGGPVPSWSDSLPGWRLESLTITDPDVLRISSLTSHPIAVPTSDLESRVSGTALELTAEQFAAVVEYEVDDYELHEVVLASGRVAGLFAARA